MKTYTLGFIFDPTFTHVLLMHKNRPDWQVGKLNGVGGKIEDGEESIDCIVREVREETALNTQPEEWVLCGRMGADTWWVDIYALVYRGNMADAQTLTDEKIEWFPVNKLPDTIISNLSWYIPMTIDKLKHDEFLGCTVEWRPPQV